MQQRFISLHPYSDKNGSTSRALMNWSLMRDGCPPSAPADFDEDIYSLHEWARHVREGSKWHEALKQRVRTSERLGSLSLAQALGVETERIMYEILSSNSAAENPQLIIAPGELLNGAMTRRFNSAIKAQARAFRDRGTLHGSDLSPAVLAGLRERLAEEVGIIVPRVS